MPENSFSYLSSTERVEHPVGDAQVEDAVPPKGILRYIAFPLALVAIGVIVGLLIHGIVKINHGTFIYNLDDPYIHLALSDQIRHGNYGLHTGSHAAPSSSIIYPFLLAIASGTAIHAYLPLLINIAALFLTAFLLQKLFIHLGFLSDNVSAMFGSTAIVLIALCSNAIQVVFTGLEHSVHIACVAAIIYGLALFLDSEEVPSWLPAVIVLCPLIRYEGLALSCGALLVLVLRRHFRTALFTFMGIVVLVGSFSLFLVKIGLAPLPSSVLTKLDPPSGGAIKPSHFSGIKHLIAALSHNLGIMSGHPLGPLLAVVALLAVYLTVRQVRTKLGAWNESSLMWLVLACLLVGQILAGRWGWSNRYEDYAVFGTIMIGIYLLRSGIRTSLGPAGRDRFVVASFAALFLLVIGGRYLAFLPEIPIASNNIYEQQYQMHRFISDFWRGPVAVNDLGLVSYHNPEEVLDLGGLGSEKARILLASHADADAYRDLVASNNVHLIVIYPQWFANTLPKSWQQIGVLSLSRPHISTSSADVSFFATDDATADKIRDELAEFRKTLPPGIKLVIK